MIIVIGIITILSTCIAPLKGNVDETSFFSNYHYDLLIQSSAPIDNLTLYLPLPIKSGRPIMGSRSLTAETFSDKSYVKGSVPPNFHFNIGNMNQVPFLMITANTMIPSQEYHFGYDENVHSPAYSYLVNTRYPLGNESVFLPKYNLSEYSRVPVELNYTTVIYADFRMEGSGQLFIMNSLGGANYWYLTSDASIGNHYSDSFYLHIYDEFHGWKDVEGSMAIGTGRYLN